MAIIGGISRPFRFNETGAVEEDNALLKIKNNIYAVITTKPGTRFMEPTYGSAIKDLLGDPNDDSSAALAKKEISDKIGLWVPEVSILSTDIQSTGTTFLIAIKYEIRTFGVTDSLLIDTGV